MQYVQTATVSGTPAAGAVLTTTINGTAIAYTASATDTTLAILAGNVVAAINACTTKDPVSGLSINGLVEAAVISGGTIGITPTQGLAASSVFTLACTSSVAGVTYTSGSQLPAGHASGAIAAVWQGSIAVPQNGNYNFSVVTDPARPSYCKSPACRCRWRWPAESGPIRRRSHERRHFAIVLSATSIKTTLVFAWQSPPGLGWGVVPSASLYPRNLVTRLGNTYVRFLKATSLASALPLTATEIAWLGTDTELAVNTSCTGSTAVGRRSSPRSPWPTSRSEAPSRSTPAGAETVTVTAITAATFTAVTTQPHNGAAAAFPIVSVAAPAINRGWLNSLPGQPDRDPVGSPIPDLTTAARLAGVLEPRFWISRSSSRPSRRMTSACSRCCKVRTRRCRTASLPCSV